MLKSMTGFGRGEHICYDRKFKVEIKSVNHRFSDFTVKVPRFLNPFEDRIRHRLAKDIVRGKVDIWVNFESFTSTDITVQVNDVYADTYMNALQQLCSRYSLGEVPQATALELLARTPEVLISDKYESALSTDNAKHEIWEGLSGALEMALEQYNKMRATEGAALSRDIEENYNQAVKMVSEIRARVPRAVEEYAQKLRDRINELTDKLGGKSDDSRILTEIAVLADKSDISEEMARLESHFEQLATMLREKGAIGRKMDFLMQELNREANTVGSKSSDVSLTKSVVELKSLIEKIREQIQNIE
ncbi:MAG: YicC family protein [Defluviitaleaceae bacterium]|nr:YicC family protein [Defluviitaleaceae bacterium]